METKRTFKPPDLNAANENCDTIRDTSFRNLLASEDWNNLPVAVRDRFTKRLTPGQSVVYTGQIVKTRMNWLGKCIAHLLRPIGAPLPLDTDNDGEAAIVTVTDCPASGGQFWTRQYNRNDGFPQIVHSVKGFHGKTGLEECVGGGFGMGLKLSVKEDVLLFKSQNYFWKIFGKRIPLPGFLMPGQMTIGHQDVGDGWFHFTLNLTHPLFGTLIDQCAAFQDMKPGDWEIVN